MLFANVCWNYGFGKSFNYVDNIRTCDQSLLLQHTEELKTIYTYFLDFRDVSPDAMFYMVFLWNLRDLSFNM